ncbi:tetratricopeptide repeat protein [Thermodesulfobacteriota bacterium]
MEHDGTTRKLAAILSADVKEYSRLMSQDERGTIRTLTEYKEAMSKLIQEYKGRVVDAPGDNLLAEFGSVVDAVNCAVEIQRELAERNADLAPARQMEFRIGINLGDIVEEEKRIYGDGVNIAARIEGLADGGGICISGTAYDQVEGKIGLEYEYLGEQEVKNIEKLVRVYRILAFQDTDVQKGEVNDEGKMAYPLPDKPSIAVLPFNNMSNDSEQEYFCDGITEEIITALSKTRDLFVIARNSSFTYKGKSVKVQQVHRDLGVRYVLEGSVRKVGNRVRITAQLIDATNGNHLWADRYDRVLEDIFTLQDEITMKVITELQVNLTEGERARVIAKGTNNLEAFLKMQQGIQHWRCLTEEDNIKARKLCEEVIALDPKYERGYIVIGVTHHSDAQFGWSKFPNASLARGEEFIQKALELDDSNSLAHVILANIYRLKRQWDKALAEYELAISLDPNSSFSITGLAFIQTSLGRFDEAIALFKKAIRLDPISPTFFYNYFGRAYFGAERYKEALTIFKLVLKNAKKGEFSLLMAHNNLAMTYAMLDQGEAAKVHVEELLKLDPNFTVEGFSKTIIYKNQVDADRFINALRKAGLPE